MAMFKRARYYKSSGVSSSTRLLVVLLQIAETYVQQAYTTWNETGANFEKFNATLIGKPGGGGEYEVVTGFGWTNGVGLHLIQQYGL